MFKFLTVIFLFGLILVALLGFSFIRTVKSFFKMSSNSKKQRKATSYHQENTRRTTSSKKTKRKKVIPEDVGEYIDFEEIK